MQIHDNAVDPLADEIERQGVVDGRFPLALALLSVVRLEKLTPAVGEPWPIVAWEVGADIHVVAVTDEAVASALVPARDPSAATATTRPRRTIASVSASTITKSQWSGSQLHWDVTSWEIQFHNGDVVTIGELVRNAPISRAAELMAALSGAGEMAAV